MHHWKHSSWRWRAHLELQGSISFVCNSGHGNSSAKALLNLVWIREAKKMRMTTRITGMSHIYKKQLVCGSRTEKTGNTLVGEDVEQLEVSSAAGRSVQWCNHFGKLSDSFLFYEVKHVTLLWSSDSTPKYLPRKNQNVYPHQGLD